MRAIMLTSSSSNQYLRPEYLTPLPTTLDAKKSPLALLAQTCSQIGADPPSSSAKSSLLNASISAAAHHSAENPNPTPSSSNSSSTPTGKAGNSKNSNNKSQHQHPHETLIDSRHRKATSVSPVVIVDKVSASSSNQSINVSDGPGTTNRSSSDDYAKSRCPGGGKSGSKATTPNPRLPGNASPNNFSPTNPANKSPTTTAPTPPVTSSTADSNLSSSSSTSTAGAAGSSSKAQVVHLPESSAKIQRASPLNFSSNSSVDLPLTLKHTHQHGLPFQGIYPPGGTGIPPYLHSYARLKAAAAASASSSPSSAATSTASAPASVTDTIPSGGCRDPYCTGCQLGSHGLGGLKIPPCPAGCVQCDHHKNPMSLFGGFSFLPGFPGFPGYYHGGSTSSIQPYVCSWIVGENYCGKRFSSSEELRSHLRSHTHTTCFGGSSSASAAAAAMEASVTAAAVQNLAAAAAAAGYPPSSAAHLHHPLLSSSHGHGLLSRSYPTPPLSPHSSGRFHPYSKPGTGHSNSMPFGGPLSLNIPPSSFLPGFSGLGHPSLSPYYPYSLYGQRLGASAGSLHP